MKKLTILSTFGVLGLAGTVQAAPPVCGPGPDPMRPWLNIPLDCLRDEVLVLDPKKPSASGKPLYACDAKDGKPDPKTCKLDHAEVAARALEVIGQVPNTQWDQFVIFGADITHDKEVVGPLFYREGYTSLTPDKGVNEVANIGLPKVGRSNKPYVGYVYAGTTAAVGSSPGKGEYKNCGKAGKTDRDPMVAGDEQSFCFPRYYTFFDALAQATGNQFGPHIQIGMGGLDGPNSLSTLPAPKRALALDGKLKADKSLLAPRVWNAFLNTKGSIFGGNTWRDNGNGTWENTKPTPYYGINPPWGRPGSETGVSAGAQLVRFQPLDLYLMGFLPPEDPELANLRIQFFNDIQPVNVYRPPIAKFEIEKVGPQMGMRAGVAIKPPLDPRAAAKMGSDIRNYELTIGDIMSANNGQREPKFDRAPHYLKQLWIVVAKPDELTQLAIKPSDDMKAFDKSTDDAYKAAVKILDNVATWRRQWNHYFYMLTGYRGRIITTYDGVDDAAYFEFGQPVDDKVDFEGVGAIDLELRGTESVSPLEAINVARVKTVGPDDGIRYTGKRLPLRISLDQKGVPWPTNSIAVRMRIAPGVPRTAFARLVFDDGNEVRIPSNCGQGAAGCKEEAALIPDWKWRTYSATLPDMPEAKYSSFTFYPLSVEASTDTVDVGYPAAVEIEFIRISNVASNKDSDKDGLKERGLCKGKAKPDGWIDSEDNCKEVYNPLQEDGNEDGIGDACEDFDGDGVENACDNCPTLTNSAQKDSDGDTLGDICDGGIPESCFLTPESLGGRLSSRPTALAGAFFLGVAGLIATRRFRRRR